MKILLLRHGIAEDGRSGMRDADRALTAEGIAQLEEVAAGLAAADVRVDDLRSSPLRRAVETARLVRKAVRFDGEARIEPDLEPDGAIDRAVALLETVARTSTVMLVGHLPHLSLLAAWLVGARGHAVHLKKAGLVRIDLEGKLGQGAGELRWLLTPSWMVSRGGERR